MPTTHRVTWKDIIANLLTTRTQHTGVSGPTKYILYIYTCSFVISVNLAMTVRLTVKILASIRIRQTKFEIKFV